jgi:hypothetical protein
MLDVLTWVAVFLLGGLIASVAGAIFIAAIYFLQNGGKDD